MNLKVRKTKPSEIQITERAAEKKSTKTKKKGMVKEETFLDREEGERSGEERHGGQRAGTGRNFPTGFSLPSPNTYQSIKRHQGRQKHKR